jgi:solute:Na+ symporter, SSS family
MSPSAVSMPIIFGIVLAAAVTGMVAGMRRQMNLEQWTVAGRGFGLVFVWLLVAGEVYTTFSFFGASGWAYSRGGPTLYILSYMPLAYVVSFFILPKVWEAGRRFSLHTQADFFEVRYNSKALGSLVALVGVLFIVPYLQLQLTGLGIIVQVASFDAISRPVSISIAFVIVAGFVLSSGIRAVAWVSILKDSLMLFAALAVGLGVPYYHFGGVAPMFRVLAQAKPLHLTMPGSTAHSGHVWYISTVLLTALGAYMWPHSFGSVFSARSGDVLRRNAVIMPLYNLTLPLLFFVGYAAILIVPGLKDPDMALLIMVRRTFSPWLLGIIGGAGALTAMVPAAILILSAGTLFAKNFFRPVLAPQMSDDSVARLAKIMVVVMASFATYLALHSSATLVSLLLFAYSGITQFFPGVVLGLYWDRVNSKGIAAGMLVGLISGMLLTLTKHDPVAGISAGFIALCLNGVTGVVISLLTAARPSPFSELVTAEGSADEAVN